MAINISGLLPVGPTGLFGPLLACCCSRVREDKQLECLELLLEQGVNMDVHES